MLTIAVCDDDRTDRMRIRNWLEKTGMMQETELFESGEALLRSERSYQIIFLDIDMKGMSGIDTARLLRRRDKKVKIIYVTAYEDFRDYAFSVHAFGYLVKPLDEKTFLRVFREALEYGEEEQEKILKFVTEDGLKEIEAKDILYLEYQNRRIRMVTRGGELWIRERMFKMEEKLAPEGFYMPHKSFLVNFYHVKNLRGYEICMSDGSRIPISQKKSAVFREALSAWLAEQI